MFALAAVSSGCGGSATCAVYDLCAKLTVERVNATCGLAATSTKPTQSPSAQGVAVSACEYLGDLGVRGSAQDTCYSDASLAKLTFDAEVAAAVGANDTREELTVQGKPALYRTTPRITFAELYVLDGNTLVYVHDAVVTDFGTSKQCLTALATDVLAF